MVILVSKALLPLDSTHDFEVYDCFWSWSLSELQDLLHLSSKLVGLDYMGLYVVHNNV